jgi:hypothetical protein
MEVSFRSRVADRRTTLVRQLQSKLADIASEKRALRLGRTPMGPRVGPFVRGSVRSPTKADGMARSGWGHNQPHAVQQTPFPRNRRRDRLLRPA